MKLNILSGKISWFGKHSGYEPLTDYFPTGNNINVITTGSGFFGKVVGKILQVVFGWEKMNPQDSFAELKLLRQSNPSEVSHILYMEGHVAIIKKMPESKKRNLIGTIHLPMSEWSEERLVLLKEFKHAIILYKEEIQLFAKYIPIDKIKFIRLGISTNFFKPIEGKKIDKNKLLIIGHYLRNFDMLFKVYEHLSKEINELEFHVIIPAIFRNIPELIKMGKEKNIFFHQNLSDEELLEKYQESYVLLIPMNDSGANTAIVQALAAALPVITTDVGGIRSYGGGEIFPVVENNNVEGMVNLFKKYYYDPEFRNDIAVKQRVFAVDTLEWKKIAQQHLELYESIINN